MNNGLGVTDVLNVEIKNIWKPTEVTNPRISIISPWTKVTMPFSTAGYDLIWNDSVFCSVVTTGTISGTSTDGITWNQGTMPSNVNWSGLAWNGTVFCTVSSTSGTAAATSTDGITWVLRTLPATGTWSGIAWNGTVFCTVSSTSGTDAATSTDGITWVLRTLPATGVWSGIAWNGTVFFTKISATTTAATSTDGTTWALRTVPTEVANYSRYNALGSNIIIINASLAYGSLQPYISADGITWQSIIVPYGAYFRYIQGDGVILALPSISTYRYAAISTDCVTWRYIELDASTYFYGSAWNGTVFCGLTITGTQAFLSNPDATEIVFE